MSRWCLSLTFYSRGPNVANLGGARRAVMRSYLLN
jgi:hypothetical protein